MLILGDKSVSLRRVSHKGAMKIKDTPNLEEIEKIMKFDEIQPIQLTPSDEQDMNNKNEDLHNWYEDELREFFSQNN